MDRRKFLKYAAVTGCGIALGENIFCLSSSEAAGNYDLVVTQGKGKSPASITEAAINEFGGIRKFISRGDIVVIKPNIGWDRLPEQAANTNPEVLATIVKLCFEAGAKKVKVFDRSVNDQRRCYKQRGLPMPSVLSVQSYLILMTEGSAICRSKGRCSNHGLSTGMCSKRTKSSMFQ